ncbi:MAG: hypothetical protein QOH81_2341 [Sphingomonadales bacterium]|jgi:hypothetical protein|nr:hypothetical protein [Sphingomonadales bacterium]
MSDSPEGVHAADILIGTFIILFGLCTAFVGGACTIGWISILFPHYPPSSGFTGGGFGWIMLLVSVGAVAFGLFCIVSGVRTARGTYRKKRPDAEGGAGGGTG